MLNGEALHRALLEHFGARQPAAIELPIDRPVERDGVIVWTPGGRDAVLIRVVEDRVIMLRDGGDEAQRTDLVRWLAALDPRALALVSPDRPLRYVEGSPLPELPGHAIVHPSLTGAGPSKLTVELLSGRLYEVALVHRSEVADDMDAKWAKAQRIDLRHDPRRAPCSAFRSSRTRAGAKKTAPVTPSRPQSLGSEVAIIKTGDTVEIENAWRHRLRLTRPLATWLDLGLSRPFVGLEDARAIARAFVDRDEALAEPEPLDVLEAASPHQQLEARACDIEGDVEPVEIIERSTHALVARWHVQRVGDVLVGRYALLDPRLGEAHVRPIFDDIYLHTVSRHRHREAVSSIRLEPADGAGATHAYDYPAARGR